jgi:hypothetical protein
MPQRKASRILALIATLAGLTTLQAQPAVSPAATPTPNGRLSLQAVALPGTGFQQAAGFEIIDWNLDGLPDLYIHDAGSIACGFIHLNLGTKTQPRFSPIGVPHLYNCTETFPQTIEHSQARTFCDFNHDGLPDLTLFDGFLRYLPNTGHTTGWNMWHLWKNQATYYFPGTPAMVAENDRLSASPESMFWDKGIFARQVITITAGDFDTDGLQDLVVCRMTTQQPGIRKYPQMWDQWTPRGRLASKIAQPLPPFTGTQTLGPLSAPPARETVFYKNTGAKETPHFDKGITLASVTAPNPVLIDVDGDGLTDIVSSEAPYASNAFRVDWPTVPNVVWFKRKSSSPADLATPVPFLVNNQTPIPAGTMARLADMRASGSLDLLVMDADASIRWYINSAPKGSSPVFAPAITLKGDEFPRFSFMFQPIVVNWFGPDSRDLILHGVTDPHCKWGLRRTTLFKNTATKPGEISYQRVGDLTFNGDPAIVHPGEQDSPYGVYGSYASVMPDNGQGKRLLMSVDGKVFLFSALAPDGLTFTKRTPIPLAARRDIFKGWQEFPLSPDDAAKPVSYIRIGNSGNSLRMVNLLSFQAISAGKNIATLDQGASIANVYPDKTPNGHKIRNPNTMLTPGVEIDPKQFNPTSFGFFVGPAVIKLAQPAKIQRIKLHLADRDEAWYKSLVPFEWQGKTYRMTDEAGQYWAQINIEVSPDGQNWTKILTGTTTEMGKANPVPIDWNHDGKTDLIVAALGQDEVLYPSTLTYRLYINHGTEADPVFGQPILASTEKKQPLSPRVPWTAGYSPMAGLKLIDMDADGKIDMLVESPSPTNSQVQWRKNISTQPNGFVFESTARDLKNDLATFTHHGRYRYFDYADVDGDGIPDLLNAGSVYQRLYFIKGVHPSAPKAVTDLAVDAHSPRGATLSWTRPTGTESYDLRWSELASPSQAKWSAQPGLTAAYTVPVGQRQMATIPPVSTPGRIYASVKSIGVSGHPSSASATVDFISGAARLLSLSNGLPDASGQAYAGCAAITLAQSPTPNKLAPLTIAVLPPPPNLSTGKATPNALVTLIHFAGLPKTPVDGATLKLTAVDGDSSLKIDNASGISCSLLDLFTPQDLVAATWQQIKPGKTWPQDDPLKAGQFISFGNPTSSSLSASPSMRWDVTQAVNQAIAQQKTSVTLLLRLDYTGHYTGGGSLFHAHDAKAPNTRPALELQWSR